MVVPPCGVAHGALRVVHRAGGHSDERYGDIVGHLIHVGLAPLHLLKAEDSLIVDDIWIGAVESDRLECPVEINQESVLGGGGGGAAILLVGGAAVAGLVGYGVYSYVSEQQLKALLPEGVAMPENRAQTALLLWNTAGRPEPAEAPAFADVADPDTAKAAQWCVEQGLMKRRLNGKFAPGSSIPAYQVLNAYRKLAGG